LVSCGESLGRCVEARPGLVLLWGVVGVSGPSRRGVGWPTPVDDTRHGAPCADLRSGGEVRGMSEETDDARQAADDVLAAVRDALRRLEAIPDATVRAKAAGLVLREWPAERGLASEIRREAVDTMHRGGMDFPEIGAAIGTDRSRAWRIWKGMS